MKRFYLFLAILAMTSGTLFYTNTDSGFVEAVAVKAAATAQCVTEHPAIKVSSPVIIANAPCEYLNKTVSFRAKFATFTGLGLDYSPVKRPSSEYIGLLVYRDDTTVARSVPLSELKMFVKRKDIEKYTDLKQGDDVEITGKVFSDALGDGWLDIQSLTFKADKTAAK